MQPLDKDLRKELEKTVKEARQVAEAAATAALEQFGVAEANPYPHLSESERELRRRLRVHGRQLGDTRDGQTQVQDCGRLIEEIAYEHWHRMLFARFLAENDLLMYDGVAVTLEDCEELASDEGLANGWELAARLAAKMLPQIFRIESPVFQLSLPPEHQHRLERLLAELPAAVFTASDSLGWVYQFWQAKKKDEVNASEVKIGARELPAVTQLFTEPYMVSFLLDNTLGAWWAARRLTEKDYEEVSTEYTESSEIEKELRRRASIPGVPLEYLRFVSTENTESTEKEENKNSVSSVPSVDKKWVAAAGTFDGWPEHLADLKTLDPCCGSGHFLVAAFLMLVPMRMALEGLSAKEAVDAVLRDNLHGLELDQRCVELAAFALALTAWNYPNAGGYRVLPELHLACSGLSVSVAKEEWKQLGLGKQNLTIALDWLHDTFRDAPVLGSLLNPAKTQAAKLVQWHDLAGALEQALKMPSPQPLSQGERGFSSLPSPSGRGAGGEGAVSGEGFEQQEVAVVAQGLAKAATLLAGQYQWVITNVPYLARGKQNERLRDFCEKHYPAAKNDLATVFLDRCLELCVQGGTASIVLPQNWLFLTSYKKFREKLLKNDTWHLIARLGPQAFQTPMWDFNVQLISLSRGHSTEAAGGLFGETEDGNLIRGVDVSEPRTAGEKAEQLQTADIKSVEQAKQLENPDARLALERAENENFLSKVAIGSVGIQTGDYPRFSVFFWEIIKTEIWDIFQSTVINTCYYGGLSRYIRYENGAGALRELASSEARDRKRDLQGQSIWGRVGVSASCIGRLPVAIYARGKFDNNAAVITPTNSQYLTAIWCFCSSPEYNEAVRRIDQKLNVTNATLVKVPFDLDHWSQIAAEKYPHGLPKPYTDDPTQWIFHGHPCGSVIWDEETKRTAHGLLRTDDTVLQVAVARLLGYRWPAEFEVSTENTESTENEDKKTSVSSVPSVDQKMELSEESIFWVKQCEQLLPLADEDGIVCIPSVRGEASAADRLLNLLAAAYGETWSNDTLAALLTSADHAGKTLETWLREKFFTQHCKLFQHRPFIWHIWDGLRDGFAALVNYHTLDYKTLEALIYTYLGDWISRQKQDIASGVDGAQERLAAAEVLKKKLELILEGEAPYDIFVRWKPLEQQPIGWNPDLNDGVRLNIRPFLSVPDVGKKGAGVLRDKPNIKWDKDRGKDVASAPWFHQFNGDRINDHHLSLEEKKAAREKGHE